MPTGTHGESEDHPWAINIPDHAARSDSKEYVASRAQMLLLVSGATGPAIFPKAPNQDHHGGGLWAWTRDDPVHGQPFYVLNTVGMEWSSQFCAAPEKVDQLRVNAARFYGMFPRSAAKLGIETLLTTPITDPAGVANWVDSICNASVPLPAEYHTAVLPAGPGIHHYPKPIEDIAFIKRDDFTLFVNGGKAAVTPVGPPGSGDGRVRVVWAEPATALGAAHRDAVAMGTDLVLPASHALAAEAFQQQTK
jgi:hypothetical protein